MIVPVYNEVAHLDELLQAIHASPVKKEIIIVDDGSTDGTREKLRGMPLANDVTVVFHEKNCGKGAAIRTALAYARGEYILIQDSDLEYDPQDYPALLRPLEEREANVWTPLEPGEAFGTCDTSSVHRGFVGIGLHDGSLDHFCHCVRQGRLIVVGGRIQGLGRSGSGRGVGRRLLRRSLGWAREHPKAGRERS